MKYVDALKQTKQETESALAEGRAATVAAQIGLDIATRELALKTANNSLAALKGEYPLDLGSVLQAQNQADLQGRIIKQLKELSAELFG